MERPRGPSEHSEQAAVVRWWRQTGCRLRKDAYGEEMSPAQLWAVPNGGTNSAIMGKRLNDEGRLAGVADLFLQAMCWQPARSHIFGGLFVEMKRQTGGRQSPSQRNFEAMCWRCGYAYVLCRGFEDAIHAIESYIMGDLETPPECMHPELVEVQHG